MSQSVSNDGETWANATRGPRPARSAPVDKLPPHSEEAERGVLGCILIAPNECLGECVTKFKSAVAFYDLRHQMIYAAMVAMWDQQRPIDVITLQQWLKDQNSLEQVGGIAYLSSLPDVVPSAANLVYYLEIVWEKYLLRKAIQVCGECIARVYEFEGDVEALLDTVEADILKVNEGRSPASLRTLKELISGNIQLVEDMHRGVGMMGGIRTRFGYLDKMTGGLHRKEMIIIAGRPSLGKTSLAMGLAYNIAKFEHLPVGVFSLEMNAEDLSLRLWCAEAGVNFHKLRTGFAAQDDLERLTTAAGKVAKLPIHIDDEPGLSILEVRAKARRMRQQFGCEVFVVDYLQLLHSTNERAKNREQEVADISSGLKGMAKELNVPVIVLAQLNREAEKRKYAKPQLSDLRESGAIEQDADFAGILYKPKQENEEDEDGDEIKTNLYIAKQRNGPTGDVEFLFKRWCMKFEDAYGNMGHAAAPAGVGISGVSKIDPGVDAQISRVNAGTSNAQPSTPNVQGEMDPPQQGEF